MKLLLTTLNSNNDKSALTLKYLYGVVADAPLDTTMREFTINNNFEYIYDEIVRGSYNIICFISNTLNLTATNTMCENLKKAMPSSLTIMTGKQISYNTKEYMEKNPYVDFVIRGEAELVLYNFVKTLLTYQFDFESIAGLAYRENDQVYVNPMEAPVILEDLAFPYERFEVDIDKTVYYESSRGCPYKCSYCLCALDKKIRSLPLKRTCTDLRYFIVKEVKKVEFTDSIFNYNTERAYRIWEYLINNDNGITSFIFEVNGDLLDDESIKLLSKARPGMFIFRVGIQSTNPETLAAVHRKENIYPLMYNISKLIIPQNIIINVSLMAGLPYETFELFKRSFNKVYGLGANTMNIVFLDILKGTELRHEAEKFGYQYRSNTPYEVISNDFISSDEIIRIKMVAKLHKLYKTEGGFEKGLDKMMTDMKVKPFDFYDKLADFFYENKLQNYSYKKEDLYRILYMFATSAYDEINNTLELPIVSEIIHSDMENNLRSDLIRKFDKKGWELHAGN